jgi:hypothetical protein
MKNSFESLRLSKFQNSQIPKSSLNSITGGIEYTEGGKKVDANGNGFAYEGDRVYYKGKIPMYAYSGFKCMSNGVVSGTNTSGCTIPIS